MPWFWPRKQRRENEQLKEQLRRRAQAGGNRKSHHYPREASIAAAAKPGMAQDVVPPAAQLLGHGYSGNDLTLYIRRKGRALAFGSRPRPKVMAEQHQLYLGSELTLHVPRHGKPQQLNIQCAARANVGRRLWQGIRYIVSWVFAVKPKILIIERYLWTECFGHFMLGSLGFTIFMLITSLFTLGEKIFSKHIPPFTIARVLMLSVPAFFVLAIPVAVIFATLMGMGRLNRDNEVVAFSTNGISLYRIFIPFVSLGIFAGVLTWLVYEHVVPPNNQQYKDVLKVFWEAQVVEFIKPGIVIKAPDKKYFYVEEINKTEGVMYNLRLYDYFAGEQQTKRTYPRIFLASEARVRDKFLVLNNVKLYELDKDLGNSVVSCTMPEIKIDISARTQDYPLKPHPTEMTAIDLRNRISQERDSLAASRFPSPTRRQNLLADWTEYYFKYSIPIACLAFVLVGVPVSLRGPRDERNLGIILTFILVMIYYVIFFICRTLGSRGLLIANNIDIGSFTLLDKGTNLFPPQAAGWLAPTIFLIASVFLIWRARK